MLCFKNVAFFFFPNSYSVLVIDATLVSDNPLHFRNHLLEMIYKLIMTIDDKIRDERLKYNINREAKKTKKTKQTPPPSPPALSSCKIDIHDCVTGEEISPSHLHSLL